MFSREYIECPITCCNYFIVTQHQNTNVFTDYCQNALTQLNKGAKINYSLRCHSFLYGKNKESIKVIQFAECFNNSIFQKFDNSNKSKKFSLDFKNGMILISPFEKYIKIALGQLFSHDNVKIITYDFTADATYLMDEEISFSFKSIIDGNINKFTGSKMFETPFSGLFTASKKSKLYRPNKNSKNNSTIHTSNEFAYHLSNSEEPIEDLFDNQFWESIVNDCAYVAIACAGTIMNKGLKQIIQFTSEKIKAFCEIQKQFGIRGPLLMKKFFNDDNLLHSNEIPNENYAYNLWIATQDVLLNYDLYNKIVPKNMQISQNDILYLQKRAENKILNIDEEQPATKPAENNKNTTNTANANNNNNVNSQSNKNSNSISCWKIISEKIQTNAKEEKKRTGNFRIDGIISTIDFFVKQNSPFLTELGQNWDNLYPLIFNIQQFLTFEEPTFVLIENSIQNIKKYNKSISTKKFSKEHKKLMKHNVNDILVTIKIFLSFLSNKQIKKESKIIGKKLFKVIFNPMNDDSYITKIFSVYRKHDDFIYTEESIANFKSSTGSGKTRCAPFFFSIKAIEDKMKRPFFIMTQPGFSIIKDKMKDFQNILGDSVTLVKDIWEMVDLYTSFINSKNRKKLFEKPIVGLFSPQSLLTLIHKLQKRKINICSITRFCLDEIHERSVESDVLEAILSTSMNEMMNNNKNFPLQLLMMSATPDTRILNCFNKVVRFDLPNSQLFPVETIQVRVDNKNQVNGEVFKQTCEVVKKMATKKIQNGHILIFTSGNSRINDIQTEIFENAEENCSSESCIVFVIKNFDMMFKNSSISLFYSNLDDFIQKETKRINSYYKRNRHILFLLPIKYMGYVSNEQKEIGKNPIPKHSNVVKIIMATNAIESSITIDGLAAVIDSGLFNHSSYDKSNGLTSLNEEPISIQSQTQRKGRVGRIRPGISVQITLKDKQLPALLPPAIKTSDISLNILSLRKIGYKLENIQNLPDSLEKEEIDRYISELVTFKALDKNTFNLTSYGRVLGNFTFVSPFIASAIIKVSGFKSDEIITKNSSDKEDDKNYIEKQFKLLLGIMISLLFGAPDLCVNRFSRKLRYYFDEKSDIITLLRTLLDLAQMKTIDIKSNAFYYGLNAQIAVKILGQVQQAAENLFFSKKEMRQISTDEGQNKKANETKKKQLNASKEQETSNKDKHEDTNVEHNEEIKEQTTVGKNNETEKERKNIVIHNNDQKGSKKELLNIVIERKTEPIKTVTSQQTTNNGPVIQKKSSCTITIEKNKSSKLIILKPIMNTDDEPKTEIDVNNDNKQIVNEEEKNTNNNKEENNDQEEIKENNSDNDKQDNYDKLPEPIDRTNLFSRKNIFKYLLQLVDKLISDNLLFKFIQDLINEIGKNKPEWINCRKAKFANIEYAYDEPSFIYSGDKSLSNDNSSSFICIRMRPGSVGLDSPGSAFILSITHELNSRINYGALIHCDLEEEEKNPIPHPISIETTSQLINDFSEPLIESYLSENLVHFKKFCRERWNRNDEGNCLLFKSQDTISESNTKYYFSFIPKDEEAKELFNEASKIIEPLLAYTPSTLLIKHPNLKCTIAIRGVGTDKIDSSVHFFTDNDYFPYQLNKRTIMFLIRNIHHLSSLDESISIGMTGESFCYPLGDSSFKRQNYSRVWYPQSNSKCSSVFSNEPFFYSHLVMLSRVEFSKYSEFLLPWDSNTSSLEIVEDDLILHAANEIAREIITVRKSFSRLLLTTDDSYIKTKGSFNRMYSHDDLFLHRKKKETGEINDIFNQLVKQYIQGDSLKSPVELTAVFYAIPRDEILPAIGYIPKAKNRKVFGYGCHCFDVDDDNAIEDVKEAITRRLNELKEMENKAFLIIKESPELKAYFFNLIDEEENPIELVLSAFYGNEKLFKKYFDLKDKKDKIKDSVLSIIKKEIPNMNFNMNSNIFMYRSSYFQIFCGDKENIEQIFQLINQYKELRCMVFRSIPEYYLSLIANDPLFSNIIDNSYCYQKIYKIKELLKKESENEEIQKYIYDKCMKINQIKESIISTFNCNYGYNREFLSFIVSNDEIKNQFLELFCNSDKLKDAFESDITLKIDVYEQIKTNDDFSNLFFDIINERAFIKERMLKVIKKDNEVINKILKISKQKTKEETKTSSSNHNLDSKIETLQVYSVTIKHNIRSSLSKEEFEEKVSSVVSNFGAIIAKQHPYTERWTMNGMVKGTITILMYSSYFTLPLVSMIKEALQESDSCSTLNIPNNIIDNVLLNDHTVSTILKEWFKSNQLKIKQNDLQLTGSEEDVKNALDKLKTNPPEIPFNTYPIQGHINLFQINNHVKHLNRNKETKWYLNRTTRTLLIPSNEDENEVSNFLSQFNINVLNDDTQSSIDEDESKIDKILWDIDFHEESAILSRYLINIYLQNGKLVQRHFCVECVYDTFLYNLRKMYNEDEDRGIYEEIINDDQLIPQMSFVECKQFESDKYKNLVQMFPIIPFGQLIWAFINESKISNQTRTWITALALRILRKSPKITFCPIHPYILFPSPPIGTKMKCVTPNCCFSLCCWCNQWHKKGDCDKAPEITPGVRECPFCHEMVEKSQACNHIHCRCGKDFCYYCGKGFSSSEACYTHMSSEKHWEEAPDYAKYIQHKVIDINALNQFYLKYPNLKPKPKESK
ncbi:hypothetical protein M9Y10_012480 [Tritrichomonas musculus]|uniref:Helicase conserved C-terminal domain containing protein n=1 Tax=Tritrichomonas musculus TaxID=1915356 RepID=A0ABR2IDR8_9EUKA